MRQWRGNSESKPKKKLFKTLNYNLYDGLRLWTHFSLSKPIFQTNIGKFDISFCAMMHQPSSSYHKTPQCDSLVRNNLLFHCLFSLQLRINLFFAQNIKPAKITRTHIIVKRKNPNGNHIGYWNCTIFTIHNKCFEKHMRFICKCICTYQSCKQIPTISFAKYSFRIVAMLQAASQALEWFVFRCFFFHSFFHFRCGSLFRF